MARPLMATIPFVAENLNEAAQMQRRFEEEGIVDKGRGDFAQVSFHSDGHHYCVLHSGNVRATLGDLIKEGWL